VCKLTRIFYILKEKESKVGLVGTNFLNTEASQLEITPGHIISISSRLSLVY